MKKCMKRAYYRSAGFSKIISSCLLLGLGVGCASQEEVSAFLVTEPSENGVVTVVSTKGAVAEGTSVQLNNVNLGIFHTVKAGSDGYLVATFPATSTDTLKIEYWDADGSEGSEEVQPEEDLVSIHGLLTETDQDGDPETKGCYILVRDDLAEDSTEPAEYVLVPPCRKGPPPEEGGEGGQPPEDGETPPPDGSQPPHCGCQPPPAEGSEPPEEGSEPPEDGTPHHGQHPPIDMAALVGSYITVVGHTVPERDDAPCKGAPFEAVEAVPDDEGSAEMSGKVEASTDNSDCVTLLRTDLFDATGSLLADYEERYELSGTLANELSLLIAEGTASFSINGYTLKGGSVCGYDNFQVSSYQVIND